MGQNSPSFSRIINMQPPPQPLTSIGKKCLKVGEVGRGGQNAKVIQYFFLYLNDTASNRKGLDSTVTHYVKLRTSIRSY